MVRSSDLQAPGLAYPWPARSSPAILPHIHAPSHGGPAGRECILPLPGDGVR